MGEVATLGVVHGFWEVGAYKTNVRRIKDGIDQIDELSKMAKERAEIECKYAKALQMFSEKWRGQVERTVQEGSIRAGWVELIEEAEASSAQHSRVRDRLLDEIVKTLALFRKENHHPSAFRSPKEIREIEEAFEKAQKQWKKLYDKVESSKKSYHTACRSERSCQVLLTNAQADTSVSPDSLSKMKDRLQKQKDEVVKSRTHYETHLQEIAQYRGPYIENMTFVFEKCQLIELKRARFVVEMMSCKHAVLADISRNSSFHLINTKIEKFLRSLDESALSADLKEWSKQYGVDAPANWPVYEEYTPEMRQIANRSTTAKESGGVVLTRQIIKNDDVPQSAPTTSAPKPSSTRHASTTSGKASRTATDSPPASLPHLQPTHSDNAHHAGKDSDSDTNTYDSRRTDPTSKDHSRDRNENNKPMSVASAKASTWDGTESYPTMTPDSAKYADFDESGGPPSTVSKGRQATVLYDYSPMEDDEISLKKGDRIELLSDPDSLGWCQGRVNGVSGLFPASYVQAI